MYTNSSSSEIKHSDNQFVMINNIYTLRKDIVELQGDLKNKGRILSQFRPYIYL
jgi:hypothetical protein